MLQARAWLFGFQQDERAECIIAALPLYHIFALTACTFVYVTMGAKVVLVTNPRDVPAFVRTLAEHKFTVLPGVNTLFTALMNHEDFASLDFSSLRYGRRRHGCAARDCRRMAACHWHAAHRGPWIDGDIARRDHQPGIGGRLQRVDRAADFVHGGAPASR